MGRGCPLRYCGLIGRRWRSVGPACRCPAPPRPCLCRLAQNQHRRQVHGHPPGLHCAARAHHLSLHHGTAGGCTTEPAAGGAVRTRAGFVLGLCYEPDCRGPCMGRMVTLVTLCCSGAGTTLCVWCVDWLMVNPVTSTSHFSSVRLNHELKIHCCAPSCCPAHRPQLHHSTHKPHQEGTESAAWATIAGLGPATTLPDEPPGRTSSGSPTATPPSGQGASAAHNSSAASDEQAAAAAAAAAALVANTTLPVSGGAAPSPDAGALQPEARTAAIATSGVSDQDYYQACLAQPRTL